MNRIMLRTIFVSFFISGVSVLLTACGNPELDECKAKASAYWDSTKDDPKDNKAYWDAIERCKERYDK